MIELLVLAENYVTLPNDAVLVVIDYHHPSYL